MFSGISTHRGLWFGLAASLAVGMLATAMAAADDSQSSAAAPSSGPQASAAAGSASSSAAASRVGPGLRRPSADRPWRPTTLFNTGDPTLALTPPLGGSRGAPPGSAPPNPDPHDLEGVWWLQGYEYLLGPAPGIAPPLKPRYMKLLEERIRAKNRGTPEADTETQCLSHGMPRLMESPYPIEIVQSPGRITFLHEVAHEIRRIYMDRGHPQHVKLSFLGDSVGHWEGDTLVVDTIGLDDRPFLDDEGSAHSTQLHVIEHYKKTDGGANLDLVITVIDPVTMEHQYSYHRVYHWRPDVRPQEYICEENNRNFPVNGITVAK